MRRLAAFLLAFGACTAPALAQTDSTRSVLVTPNPDYEAGGLWRFLFGGDYRDLWTTPTKVDVLDLAAFEGGLTPVRRGGGQQTRSLRFRNPEGRLFDFRSVDKDPSAVLPPDLRGTFADDVVQDQISSAHPAGALVVAPLLEAAGVLHATPRLFVMPDDPGLGEFRAEFGGMLGTLEERADEGSRIPGLENASRVIDMDNLLDRLEDHPAEHIDTTAWLRARLMDVYVGDWDRHRGQWRWVRRGPDTDATPWEPIPEDRDQAFIRFDGFLLMVARPTNPQLTNFGARFAGVTGATWNGRELDRLLLAGVPAAVWDSVARDLQARLTDRVIAGAVGGMPIQSFRLSGTRLAAWLTARRADLPAMARRYHRYLARQADLHGTDDRDQVEITRLADGAVEVLLQARDGRSGATVVRGRRTFLPGETEEIRLYLHGADDRVTVRGDGPDRIGIRVVGGGGDDSVTAEGRAGRGVKLYDEAGRNGAAGVGLNTRPYTRPDTANPVPPRDWGSRTLMQMWASLGPDIGLFAGTGLRYTTYGFRRHPFASEYRIRAGWATAARTYRAELTADWRRENSRARITLLARASGIEILRFYGLGNETSDTAGDSDFYKVEMNQYLLEPAVDIPVGSSLRFSFGPTLKYNNLEANADRFIGGLGGLYGAGDFGEAGVHAGVSLDTRDEPAAARRGVLLNLRGVVYPALWDVDSTFGRVEGELSTYLHADIPLHPVLALRVGGATTFGTYPFHEAAYLGGSRDLRGWQSHRFAGDASAFGNAELRLQLGRPTIIVPVDVGIFGLADGGRVWLDGEDSNEWHVSAGGGVSLGFLNRASTLTLAVAAGDERTAFYARAGFLF